MFSVFFTGIVCSIIVMSCSVRAKNGKETATHTHEQLATPVSLDHQVDPTSDPTSELVVSAVSGPGKQPS